MMTPYPEWPLIQVNVQINSLYWWTVRADLGSLSLSQNRYRGTQVNLSDPAWEVGAAGWASHTDQAMWWIDLVMGRGWHLPGVVESMLLAKDTDA